MRFVTVPTRSPAASRKADTPIKPLAQKVAAAADLKADKIDALREGFKALSMAVAALANFDFGIGPAKEIFDALQAYARMRAAYFQSLAFFNNLDIVCSLH